MTEDDRIASMQEHAWRWFVYHAEQRTSMFNYFLVAASLLAAGFASAVGENSWRLAIAIGVLGAFASLCFLGLEVRNAGLVHLGEEALRSYERRVFTEVSASGAVPAFPSGILTLDRPCFLLTHKLLLRLIEGAICVAFAAGALVAWRAPSAFDHSDVRDERALEEVRGLSHSMQALAAGLQSVGTALTSAPQPTPVGK